MMRKIDLGVCERVKKEVRDSVRWNFVDGKKCGVQVTCLSFSVVCRLYGLGFC